MNPDWNGGNTTPRLEENKRKILQSSIFGGNSNAQQRSPARQYQNPEPASYNSASKPEYAVATRDYDPPMQSNYNYPAQSKAIAPAASFGGLVHGSTIPSLSSFPEVNLEPISNVESYNFSLKPRTALRPPQRSLTFKPNNQMKVLRDSLAQDMTSFQQRMKRLSVNTPLVVKMVTFDHKLPKTAVPKQRAKLSPPEKLSSPNKVPQNTNNDQNNAYNDNNNDFSNSNFSPSKSGPYKQIPPVNTSVTSLNSSMNASLNASLTTPGFSTVSEFIMPDGTSFD